MRQSIFLAYSVGDSSVSQFFSQLALKLSEECTVVIFSDRNNPLPFESQYVELLRWPSPRPTKFRDFRFLKHQIRKYRPQLVVSTFGANNVFLLGGYVGRVPHRIATYRTISSHFSTSRFKLFRKKMVFQLATRIIANSGATKDDLKKTFKVPESKVKVVYNAVTNPHIKNDRDPNLILYAGRLTIKKGVDVLLKAFRIVSEDQPNLKLKVLGGTADEIKKYTIKVVEMGLEHRVTLTGSVPRESVLNEFSRARFVVVPSLSEGFGFVVIEAFSVHTPVVGSRTGGIQEIIRHGIDGLLFEPGNEQALAHAMNELLEDNQKTQEMGANAHERFLNTFELNHVVGELSNFLINEIKNSSS